MEKQIAKLLVLLVVLSVLPAGGCRGGDAELRPLEDGAVLLAFGDSLTRGTGAGPEHSYPSVLQDLCARPVVNAGVPGELSERGARRLPDALRENRPALVVLCHGGNDRLRGLPGERTEAALRRMLAACRQAGADVILLGVPAPRLLLRVPGFYEDLAREFGAVYEGEVLRRVLGSGALKSDPIHPNAEGYRRIAERLYEILRSRGALP